MAIATPMNVLVYHGPEKTSPRKNLRVAPSTILPQCIMGNPQPVNVITNRVTFKGLLVKAGEQFGHSKQYPVHEPFMQTHDEEREEP